MNPLGQALGGRLAEQFAARVLTPAFAFWAGGLVALWGAGYGHDWPRRLAAEPAVWQVVVIGSALALIAGSALVAENLTAPVVRLLEGYWPQAVARPFRERSSRRLEQADRRLQALAAKAFQGDHTAAGGLAVAEERLHDLPVADSVMPTRLGNILRAAEDRVRDRYGLDPVVCWPHLWLALDKETREEIAQARKDLDNSARAWMWCLVFLVWTGWAWWAPVVTVVGCAGAYYGTILSRGRGYGLLMQAAFDLYRHRVYDALDWPAPADPASEAAAGAALTTYLWRGIAPAGLRFASADQAKPSDPSKRSDPSKPSKPSKP